MKKFNEFFTHALTVRTSSKLQLTPMSLHVNIPHCE